MRVWIVTIGEPLPTDPHGDRLLRHGILAEHLVSLGNEVVWWTSTFNHAHKEERGPSDRAVRVAPNYTISFLRGVGYRRNVSGRRFVDHWLLARAFRRAIKSAMPPDVILCSYPPIELAYEATRYAKSTGIPIGLDVRDWWPDTFLELLPRSTRTLGKIALAPYSKMADQAFRRATAIVGVTEAIRDFGLRRAGRAVGSLDQHFPLAYALHPPPETDVLAATDEWKAQGVDMEHGPIVCFFGTLSTHKLDLEPLIDAARMLERDGSSLQFVLCGSGDGAEHFKALASGLPNVRFPGWVNHAQIWALMQMSSAGLAPYLSSSSYVASTPNKPIEYMAAGLPVISTLSGNLEALLAETGAGVTCPNGDAQALVDVLRNIETDKEFRSTLRSNAIQAYQDRFSGHRVYDEMVRWLEELASTHRGIVNANLPK